MFKRIGMSLIIIALFFVVLNSSCADNWTSSASIYQGLPISGSGHDYKPELVFNLTGDGRWYNVQGETGSYSRVFFYNVTNQSWVVNYSLDDGLTTMTMNMRIKYNFSGTNKFEGICGNVPYCVVPSGYYWNGTYWVSNNSLAAGLNASSIHRITFDYNVTGSSKWILLAGRNPIYGLKGIDGYQWNGTGWTLNSSLVNGLQPLQTDSGLDPLLYYNLNGNGKWALFIVDSSLSWIAYTFNGTGWAVNSSLKTGIPIGGGVSPFHATVGLNVTGDNRVSMLVGTSNAYLGYVWTDYLLYSNVGTSVTSPNNGDLVLFSVKWTNDIALSGYIFSNSSDSTTWTNASFVAMTGTSNWSNVTKTMYYNGQYYWRVYVNDTDNYWNVTTVQTVQIGVPTYSSNAANNTTFAVPGNVIGFNALWAANTSLSGYTFSNSTDNITWGNLSWAAFPSIAIYASCYQETANVSTACGGLNTGTYAYNSSNWTNPQNIYDGNWNTLVVANVPDNGANSYIKINYTIPTGTDKNNVIWQVNYSGSTYNYTLNASGTEANCFNYLVSSGPSVYDNTSLRLYIRAINTTPGIGTAMQVGCFYDYVDDLVAFTAGGWLTGDTNFTEEAIYWNVSTSTSTMNWSNVSRTMPVADKYYWKFYANNSVNNWNVTTLGTLDINNPILWSNPYVSSTLTNANIFFITSWSAVDVLSGYIFSNSSDGVTWTNSSFVAFTGTSNTSSVTKNITSSQYYYWRVYANDSDNGWNVSSTQVNIFDGTSPNATSWYRFHDENITYVYNSTGKNLTISAAVTDDFNLAASFWTTNQSSLEGNPLYRVDGNVSALAGTSNITNFTAYLGTNMSLAWVMELYDRETSTAYGWMWYSYEQVLLYGSLSNISAYDKDTQVFNGSVNLTLYFGNSTEVPVYLSIYTNNTASGNVVYLSGNVSTSCNVNFTKHYVNCTSGSVVSSFNIGNMVFQCSDAVCSDGYDYSIYGDWNPGTLYYSPSTKNITTNTTTNQTFVVDTRAISGAIQNHTITWSKTGDLSNVSRFAAVTFNLSTTKSGNFTNQTLVTIQPNASAASAIYSGNISLYDSALDTFYYISTTVNLVNTAFANLEMTPTTIFGSMESSQSKTFGFSISNTGDYNATSCNMSTSGTLGSYADYSYTNGTLNISAGEIKNVSVSYLTPPVGDYNEMLTLTCVVTAAGNISTESAAVYLAVTSPSAALVGGGGGLGNATIILEQKLGTYALFDVRPRAISTVAVVYNTMFGEDQTITLRTFIQNIGNVSGQPEIRIEGPLASVVNSSLFFAQVVQPNEEVLIEYPITLHYANPPSSITGTIFIDNITIPVQIFVLDLGYLIETPFAGGGSSIIHDTYDGKFAVRAFIPISIALLAVSALYIRNLLKAPKIKKKKRGAEEIEFVTGEPFEFS